MRVFLSYAREDSDAAERILGVMEAAGHHVWFDRKSMTPGAVWRDEVRQQINESDYFVALVSPNSVDKCGYVHAELSQAMEVALSRPRHVRFVIPILLDECVVRDPRLLDYHQVDMRHGFEDGLKRLLQAISTDPRRSVSDALTSVGDAKSQVNATDAIPGLGSNVIGDVGMVNNQHVAIDASMRGRGNRADISIEQKNDS